MSEIEVSDLNEKDSKLDADETNPIAAHVSHLTNGADLEIADKKMIDVIENKQLYTRGRLIGLVMGPLLLIIFGPIPFSDEHPKASTMFGCSAWIATWWLSQVCPLAATSLLPVVLFPLFDIGSSKAVSQAYFNHIQFLFIGAFMVDLAIEHVDVHRRVALNVLLKFEIRPKLILLGFMLVSWVFSMFCMNTSTTLMMVPFVLGVLQSAEATAKGEELEDIKKFGRGVLLGVAYASSQGGLATLIGTAPNGVFASAFEKEFPESGISINFGTWFAWGFPLSCLTFIPTWLILGHMYANKKIPLSKDTLQKHLNDLGPLNRDEIIVSVVQTVQMFLWVIRGLVLEVFIGTCSSGQTNKRTCTEKWSSVFTGYDGGIACGCALSLFLIPSIKRPNESILTWKYTAAHLPWDVILLLGAGFSIASGFTSSGLSQVIVGLFEGFDVPLFWFLLILIYVVIFLTEMTSNTATSSILLPILGSVARALNIHPIAVMAPVTIACSMAFMFPVATPPNAIVFGTGRISFNEMAKVGFILNIISGILILFAVFSYGAVAWTGKGAWEAPLWLNDTKIDSTTASPSC